MPASDHFGPMLALLLLSALSTPLVAEDKVVPTWPGWRGPSRDGSVDAGTWPQKLDTVKKLWRVDLGPGYGGPIVSASAVFVTETSDSKQEVVRALDRSSGKELWKARWEGAMSVPFFARKNGSWIRSTPALDGNRLYVAGMRDVLVCLDTGTGKEVWRVDFVERFKTPLPAFGFVCSPLVDAKHVYVQAGASFVALNKLDGKTAWRALDDGGGMYGSAFSSPRFAKVAGRQQLLVQTRTQLAGVSPEDGDVLWSTPVKAFRGMNILTPTASGDRIFTSTYGGGSVAFDVSGKEGKLSADQKWKDGAQGYMSSPALVDGHVYLHMRNKRMTCFELATGKRKWTTTDRFGSYMSMVSSGDRILALDERGILLLLRANPEKFELLDQKKISERSTWAHIAVCGSELFVRDLSGVTAYRWGRELRL